MEGASCLQMGRVWQRHGEEVDPFSEESPLKEGRVRFVRVSCRDGPLCRTSKPWLNLLGPWQFPGALPHPCLTPALLQLPPGWTPGSCPVLTANLNYPTRLLPSQSPASTPSVGPCGLKNKDQIQAQTFLTI